MNKFMSGLKSFWNDEEGMGTLEVILIIAVVVMVALVFRKYIISWVNKLFESADKNVTDINNQSGLNTPTP
jgi:Flp pilus assembly pilin Flp